MLLGGDIKLLLILAAVDIEFVGLGVGCSPGLTLVWR